MTKYLLQRVKPLLGEFSIIILGKVIALVVTILGIRMVTDIVSPSIYGKFGLILTFTALGELLFGILGQGIGRYYFEARNNNEYQALKAVFIYFSKNIICIIILSIFPLFFYFESWTVAICIPLYVLAIGVGTNIRGILNGERYRILVVFHEVLDKIFKYGGIVLFSFLAAMSAEKMLLSYTLFMYILVIMQLYFYYSRIEKKHLKKKVFPKIETIRLYKKKVWKYMTPFILWTIFSWIQNSADRWILEIKMSTYEVGLYQVLNQYGFQIISIGIGMITTLIVPILFEKANNPNDKQAIINSIQLNNKIVKISGILLLIAFVLTYFCHSFIFSFLAAAEYQSVSSLLPWMVLAGGFFGVGQLLSTNFMINYSPVKIIGPKIITAILSVIFSWTFISYMGIMGLVIGILMVQLIYMGWLLVLSNRLTRQVVG